MIDLTSFAAKRAQRLNDFDKEIHGIIAAALEKWSAGGDWYEDIVEGAGVLWSEIFVKTSPTGNPDVALDTFLRELRESLSKTAQPSVPPTEGEINRIANWVGVYTVNSATYFAGRDAGHAEKTWITMEDDKVRSTHRPVDGQTASILGTFDVGGYKLHFPGEPVGPPEIWINCRCLLAVTGGPEMAGKKANFATKEAEVDEETGQEMLDGEPLLDEEPTEGLVDDLEPVPWYGVLAVEGKATGDKRMFEKGALTYRDLPVPISWQRMSAEGHLQSVVIGTIDRIERAGDEIRGWGRFNTATPEANEAIDGLQFGMLGGFSVDIDEAEFEVDFKEPDGEDDGLAMLFGGEVEMTRFTAGRICGGSMVNIPAFMEAYVALGDDFEVPDSEKVVSKELSDDGTEHTTHADGSESWGFDTLDDMIAFLDSDDEVEDGMAELDKLYAAIVEEEALVAAGFAPGTHDGPGWLTHPRATQRLRSYWVHGKGALKIRWGQPGDFNRCRLQLGKYVNPAFLAGTCANLHKEALKVWPGREGGKRNSHATVSEGFALVASASVAAAESVYFSSPDLPEPTLVTVEGDHIFGHLAAWGVCHIGIGEKCVMAPHSPSDYYYAHRGITEVDGVEYATSPLIMGTGHANVRINAAMATKHYDDTGYAIADVVYGEDAHGIWFSGKLRDDVDDADLKVIKASSVSGDWRDLARKGVSDELLGAIVVNVPGFPIPKPRFAMDGDRQLALIASAGILVRPAYETGQLSRGNFGLTAKELLAIGRTVADELEYRGKRADRIAEARDPELLEAATSRRAERIAAARSLEE